MIRRFIPRHILDGIGVDPEEYVDYHADLIKEDRDRKRQLHQEAEGSVDLLPLNNSLFIRPRLAPVKYVMALTGLDNGDWTMNSSGIVAINGGVGLPLVTRDFVLAVLGGRFHDGYPLLAPLLRTARRRTLRLPLPTEPCGLGVGDN